MLPGKGLLEAIGARRTERGLKQIKKFKEKFAGRVKPMVVSSVLRYR